MKNTRKEKGVKSLMFALVMMLSMSMFAGNNKKLDEQVLKTMKTATQFMMDKVSYNGGFVWNYLPDMSRSWGELEAKRTLDSTSRYSVRRTFVVGCVPRYR